MKDGNVRYVLSDLAKRVKSFDGKLLGKDGKPLKPHRCVNDYVVSMADNVNNDGDMGFSTSKLTELGNNVEHDVANDHVDTADVGVDMLMDNKTVARGVGCSKPKFDVSMNSHGAAGVTHVENNIPTPSVGSKVIGVNNHATMVDVSLADVIIPQDEVETISARFEHSLYGYFVGQRPAFPVVQNFVRNVWKKYGLTHVMIHQGFFMFKFSSRDGMENVLNQGPWRIRSVPLILHVWNPNSDLSKEDIKKVPVWVKLYNVTVVAYSLVGHG